MTFTDLRDLHDPEGMYDAIQAFPDHLAEGWSRGAVAEGIGLDAASFDGIVIGGMGGSAIGGDLLRTLAEPTSPRPVQVIRGYDLPAWVSARTLVVVSSYSGGTEETLSLFEQAEARRARILAVTAGGEVQHRAQARGHDLVVIPGGLQPRAALGYSLGALLRIGAAMRALPLTDADVRQATAEAEARVKRYNHLGTNPAHELAELLRGMLPVIYSGTGLLEAVNLRWRTQLHENAKVAAVGNVFPELDHNEIMGFEAMPPELAARMAVVTLRDEDDHPQIRRRIDVTREIIRPQIGAWYEVETKGANRLSRLLSLVQMGDWVSYWLALLNGVNPTPVESIQQLKATLASEA